MSKKKIDNRTPDRKYEDALKSYVDLKELSRVGRAKFSVSEIAKNCGLNRNIFYNPNFSDQSVNNSFKKLGKLISNQTKDGQRENINSEIERLSKNLDLAEEQAKNAQIQSARMIEKVQKQHESISNLKSRVLELQNNLDEVTYNSLKIDNKKGVSNANVHWIQNTVVISPDNYLYIDGRYEFTNNEAKNEAWYKVKESLTNELHKKVPTRIYILVGLPCSGKTTWSNSANLYPDCRSIVIDSCNLSYIERLEWANTINTINSESRICVVVFDVPFSSISQRNLERPCDRSIKNEILESMRDRYEPIDVFKEKYINEIIVVRN